MNDMKRQKMYMDITLFMGMKGEAIPARLYKGTPKRQCPSTYRLYEVVGHDIGDLYNPSTLRLYLAKDKTLRYEIYRSGCFFPYYGKIELLKDYKL